MKRSVLTLTGAILLFACSSADVEENANDSATEVATNESVEETQQGGYNYDLEWEAFKEAIYAKNAEDLKIFFPEEGIGIDAETLLSMCSEDYVIEEMKKTPYDKLGDSEYNGNYAKEFGASVSYTDEDDNTYESGLYLYFEEGLNGLKLVNVLAAG
ncbi:MAG: hypothetical protein R2780_05155 [Crocinitomicaceae bacterium]|nr:hypothetical protein [Crocinitomicaceae bacterium]